MAILPGMIERLSVLLATLASGLRSHQRLLLENLLLCQQLQVALRSQHRPRLGTRDKRFWLRVHRLQRDWRRHLHLVRPETVLRWHRRGWRSSVIACSWQRSAVGVPPAPRRAGLSWQRFLRAQAGVVLACNFTVDIVWLKQLYTLFFIEVTSRRVFLAGCTARLTAAWVTQQARNLSWELGEADLRPWLLIHGPRRQVRGRLRRGLPFGGCQGGDHALPGAASECRLRTLDRIPTS